MYCIKLYHCQSLPHGATTLSIATFSVKVSLATCSITTFSITTLCHYAEFLFIVMLNVIMLSVVMLNAFMLRVVAPFHTSLLFAAKAKNLPSEWTVLGIHTGRLQPCLQILD